MQQWYEITLDRTGETYCNVEGPGVTGTNPEYYIEGMCDMGGNVPGDANTCETTCNFQWSCSSDNERCTGGFSYDVTQMCAPCTGACTGANSDTQELSFSCTCNPYSCGELGINNTTHCPRDPFDNGCGGNRYCGTDDCTEIGPQFECLDNTCSCVPNCTDRQCGGDGCGGGCGTCGDCDQCENYQCVPYPSTLEITSHTNTPYELNGGESITFSVEYQRIYGIQIRLLGTSTDEIIESNYPVTYDCNSDNTTSYTFSADDYINLTGTYHIEVTALNEVGDLLDLVVNTSDFAIIDEHRLGCTDECADNYPTGCNSDPEFGDCPTVTNLDCRYRGCTDPNANNYYCGSNSPDGCNNSLICTESSGYDLESTSPDYLTDDGTCQFNPIPIIDSPVVIYEGSSISVDCEESIAFQNSISNYDDYGATITSCSWVIQDQPEENFINIDTTTPNIQFDIPYYTDEQRLYGGGSILDITLTVTNSFNQIAIENISTTIGDVDIIGTQLNAFSSIYIPGVLEQSLIGCPLPPLDGGYEIVDILNNSFYDFANNPDDGYEGFANGTWSEGDVVYAIVCLDLACTAESKIQGSYSYLSAFGGWFATSGTTFNLYPGMGLRIVTTQPGWFKWSISG
jgi:hypothetical protein